MGTGSGAADDRLYLSAAIQDNQFNQVNTGSDTWRGDGLQFGLSTAEGDGWYQFDLALTPGGPLLYRALAPDDALRGPVHDATVSIERNGTTTAYEAGILWKDIAPIQPSDGLFRFSVLYNDNDGAGRKGYLRWGQGIGDTENPLSFPFCQFIL